LGQTAVCWLTRWFNGQYVANRLFQKEVLWLPGWFSRLLGVYQVGSEGSVGLTNVSAGGVVADM
jgi:hypothetical protein